jgi:hypothetical protein
VVWNVVLRASARMISVFAACRDLLHAPSQQAVFDALANGLPRTLPVLEKRLNGALVGGALPRRLRRGRREVAIDWHEEPYYGKPKRSRNEICFGKPRQGTTKFHTYATACIVEYGVMVDTLCSSRTIGRSKVDSTALTRDGDRHRHSWHGAR